MGSNHTFAGTFHDLSLGGGLGRGLGDFTTHLIDRTRTLGFGLADLRPGFLLQGQVAKPQILQRPDGEDIHVGAIIEMAEAITRLVATAAEIASAQADDQRRRQGSDSFLP